MKINKVYNMDVIEGLKQLETDSIDCVLLDPPYNIGKDFGNNKTQMPIKEYIEWASLWIAECKRVLKPSGTMFIYGFSEILAHISVNLEMDHRWLVWHYTNKTIPSLNFWQRSHESILCAWHDNSKRLFFKDKVREPYTEGFVKGYTPKPGEKPKKRPKSTGRMQSGDKETFYKVNDKGALPRDVLKHSSLAGGSGRKERIFYCEKCNQTYHPSELKEHKEHKVSVVETNRKGEQVTKSVSAIKKHPTQKPMCLTKRLISSCTPENGVVLIPFVGSGSEVFVSRKLGHNYVGFELNDEYFKFINYFEECNLEDFVI